MFVIVEWFRRLTGRQFPHLYKEWQECIKFIFYCFPQWRISFFIMEHLLWFCPAISSTVLVRVDNCHCPKRHLILLIAVRMAKIVRPFCSKHRTMGKYLCYDWAEHWVLFQCNTWRSCRNRTISGRIWEQVLYSSDF